MHESKDFNIQSLDLVGSPPCSRVVVQTGLEVEFMFWGYRSCTVVLRKAYFRFDVLFAGVTPTSVLISL